MAKFHNEENIQRIDFSTTWKEGVGSIVSTVPNHRKKVQISLDIFNYDFAIPN